MLHPKNQIQTTSRFCFKIINELLLLGNQFNITVEKMCFQSILYSFLYPWTVFNQIYHWVDVSSLIKFLQIKKKNILTKEK